MKKITVIDYGSNNLKSVVGALEYCGGDVKVIEKGQESIGSKIVLPGVGAFPQAKEKLEKSGLMDLVLSHASLERPLFGICLGMQLFFDSSEELISTRGLGLIPGKVEKIQSNAIQSRAIRVPNIGWHNLEIVAQAPSLFDSMFAGIRKKDFFYFVHSFKVVPKEKKIVTAFVDSLASNLPAAIASGSIVGTQFHPEKSGEAGLHLLRSFIDI